MTGSFLSSLFFKIIPSIIFYRTININLQKWRSSSSPTENIRIISSLHAILSTGLSSAYLCGKLPLNTFSWSIGFVSYGFSLVDLSYILLYENQYSKSLITSYIIQHLLTLVGISYINIYPYYVARGYLAELSTPFVNLSWYLSRNGYKDNNYFINGSITLGLFGLVRIANITELLYNRPDTSPFIYPFICSALLGVNCLWMRGLILVYYNDYNNYRRTIEDKERPK